MSSPRSVRVLLAFVPCLVVSACLTGRVMHAASQSAASAGVPLSAERARAEANVAKDPDDPVALAVLARILIAEQNDSEAARLLSRALDISPNQPAANLAMGNLLLRQNRLPEAMDHFETVLRISRDSAAQQGEFTAATRLALGATRAGNTEAAYRCLEHAAEFLPDSAELLTDFGLIAEQTQRYERARKVLQRALTVEPNRPATLYALARVELGADHLADAARYFRAYLSAKPEDATAWYGLGRTLHRQQRDAEADEALQRSVALQPVQTESYYELGAIALDAHRDVDAKALFARTLSRNPQHGGALTGMGEISYRARDFPAAKQLLTAAVASSPEYQPAHYYLGLTLARLGEKEASTAELARATKLAGEQQGRAKPVFPEVPPHPGSPAPER